MCNEIPATNSMSSFGDSVKQGTQSKVNTIWSFPKTGKLMTISDSDLMATTFH